VLQALRDELVDVAGTLVALMSRSMAIGLPRASGHLFTLGQLLTDASKDVALASHLYLQVIWGGGKEGNMDGTVHLPGPRMRTTREFTSFLSAHATSRIAPDHVRSDVIYIALELLECSLSGLSIPVTSTATSAASFIPADDDPFVSIMLAVPRILNSSQGDESLQLHCVAFLAAMAMHCCSRVGRDAPGWSMNAEGRWEP
ncbi:unnamed protein product, partial [Choristocarpus tenellus]